MKNIILFVFLFISVAATSQHSKFEQLWNEFQAVCDSLVNDTITEHGKIVFEKVFEKTSLDYTLVAKDTIWYEKACAEFQIGGTGAQIQKINGDWLGDPEIGVIRFQYPRKTTFYPNINRLYVEIDRIKICKIKYMYPGKENFIRWIEGKF